MEFPRSAAHSAITTPFHGAARTAPRPTLPPLRFAVALVSILLAMGLLPGAAALAQGAGGGVPDIVRRSLEHHGSALLEDLQLSLTLSSASGSFDIVAEPGDVFDYRVTGTRGGQTMTMRHTNEPGAPEASMEIDGQLQVMEGPAVRRTIDFVSARVYFLFFPYRLEDPDTTLEDLGTEDWDGRVLRKVRLTFGEGTSTNSDEVFLFWFDPDSARLEQFAYSFDGGIRFRRMVNYRRIGGVLLGDQENYAVDGDVGVEVIDPEYVADMELMSTVRLEDVEVLPRQ